LYGSDDKLSGKRVVKFRRVIADYVAARTAENEAQQILHKPLEMQLGNSWQEGINTVRQKCRIEEKGRRASETGQQM